MTFDHNPVPKPNHNRRVDKRAKRTEFSLETMEAIGERDNWLCVRCGAVAAHIHHITFRSTLGGKINHKSNGACVCHQCHSFAHSGREGREWFEKWRDKYLDEEGNFKELPFNDRFSF